MSVLNFHFMLPRHLGKCSLNLNNIQRGYFTVFLYICHLPLSLFFSPPPPFAMVMDLPALEQCMCESVEDLLCLSSGVLSCPVLPILHVVFHEVCCLFSLMPGSHLFNKYGYLKVFIPSKCLMQMYNLLSAHPSFP